MACKAIQQSDEMYCAPCGLRWDVNDPEPPSCKPKYTQDDIPADMLLLFKFLRTAELRYPDISGVLEWKIYEKYKYWRDNLADG